MAGHFRGISSQSGKAFPNLPQFSGFMKPCRFEGEIRFLEVEGDLPEELDGTFYRVMPDPQFAPFIEDDPVSIFPQPMLPSVGTRGASHWLMRYF